MSTKQERIFNEPEAKPVSEEVKIKLRSHPIYNLFYGSKCGKYIHVKRKVIKVSSRVKNHHLSKFSIFR